MSLLLFVLVCAQSKLGSRVDAQLSGTFLRTPIGVQSFTGSLVVGSCLVRGHSQWCPHATVCFTELKLDYMGLSAIKDVDKNRHVHTVCIGSSVSVCCISHMLTVLCAGQAVSTVDGAEAV